MSSWRGRRVLVTGATGLVGSWLARDLLERGGDVVALARDWDPTAELIRSRTVERVAVINGVVDDLATVTRAINQHEPDTLFHLAAQTQVRAAHRDPFETFESNVRGTYTVLEACRRLSPPIERIVVASSDKVYGDAADLPYTEGTPLEGRYPYDTSKLCADVLARSYFATYGLPVVIARCGNIYGGGDLNWDRIVPGTIRSLLRNERPIIRSDGRPMRDYVFVQEVVEAYETLAEQAHRPDVKGQAFNFSSERPLTVLEIVEAAVQATGVRLEPDVRDSALAEIGNQQLSSARARQVLGWKARWTLQDGMQKTVAWYRDFLGTP